MAWVKRNLYFLVGTAVAIALLGLAGYYFYSKWALNKENDEKLTAAYEDWKRIAGAALGPGNEKVNNIELARVEQEKVNRMIQRLRTHFVRIPAIPDSANGAVTGLGFYQGLQNTINQLTRDAANAGVKLPVNYSFSFEAERPKYTFEPGSLGPLSEQLGHVKVICGVLFKAKINSLLGVRRERVSQFDVSGVADYLDIPSVTNDLAVLAPYEVKFECFSSELGEVLAGFANLPNGLIVKTINVETNSAMSVAENSIEGGPAPIYPQYQYVQPTPLTPPGYPPGRGYRGYRPANPYLAQPPVVMQAPAPTPRTTVNAVLDERPFTVTMMINVVKLLPRR